MEEGIVVDNSRVRSERGKLREVYLTQEERYKKLAEKERRLLTRYSVTRLILFLLVIIGTVLLWSVSVFTAVGVAVAVTALFIRVVILYGRAEWQAKYYSLLEEINRNEAAAMEGDWSAFNQGDSYIDPAHNFTHDIDLFGRRSLFNYLDRTVTEQGRNLLAGWLSDPRVLADNMTGRQEAVAHLAGEREWRHQFKALGELEGISVDNQNNLVEWIRQTPFFKNRMVASGALMIFPLMALTLLALAAFSVVGFSFFILLFLVNLFVLSLLLKRINILHSLLSGRHQQLKSLGRLAQHTGLLNIDSEYVKSIQERLTGGKTGASEAVLALSGIIKSFDMRLNMVAGVLLNGLFLWDYIQVLRLERWRESVRNSMDDWFMALSEADALISLANYAFNNPEFVYPVMSTGIPVLEAEDLGHPLIDPERRVVNDFRVSEKGEIFIITGANMAGKSTFLRTVAVNMVLAMIGAPVCATSYIFTPLTIFSSMRTSDSLSENESYFYAELKRLKSLKEKMESGDKILFLLDEILKGTNSKDKSEGSWSFIEKIISLGGTGIIATHDTSLGKLAEKYPANIRNRCFEIEIRGESILFDYLLRDGITTRMNAGMLMRQQGIID